MNPAEEEGDFPDEHTAPPHGDGVDGLLAAARQSDAALRRRRRRWREEQRSEERSVDDALLGAVGARVVGHLVGGTDVAGLLEAVGADVVQIDLAGRRAWIALDAIAAIELASTRPGDPSDRDDATLGDVLDDLAAEQTAVTVDLRSGARFAGTVVATGGSVELRRADRNDTVVVRPEAIASVTARARR